MQKILNYSNDVSRSSLTITSLSHLSINVTTVGLIFHFTHLKKYIYNVICIGTLLGSHDPHPSLYFRTCSLNLDFVKLSTSTFVQRLRIPSSGWWLSQKGTGQSFQYPEERGQGFQFFHNKVVKFWIFGHWRKYALQWVSF